MSAKIAKIPFLAAGIALITAAWPLYVSVVYLLGGTVSIAHLNACMLVSGLLLSLFTTPLLRDRLLCYGDTYMSLFAMAAYAAGIGILQAGAAVMNLYAIRFGKFSSPANTFRNGGFSIAIAAGLILPVVLYAAWGTRARPAQKLSIKRRIISVTVTILCLIGIIVPITMLNDETVLVGGAIPISYVVDDLIEGVTVCPMGLSQLKMSGMSVTSAAACLGVMQVVGNVDRLVSLIANTLKSQQAVDLQRCFTTLKAQATKQTACRPQNFTTMDSLSATEQSGTSWVINADFPMYVYAQDDYSAQQAKAFRECSTNSWFCFSVTPKTGNKYVVRLPRSYYMQSESAPLSDMYNLCKQGYAASMWLEGGLAVYCPANKTGTPTCEDLGLYQDEVDVPSVYSPSQLAYQACDQGGKVYTKSGQAASPNVTASCTAGYYVTYDGYYKVRIESGTAGGVCAAQGTEDVYTVVGVTAAKVFCIYAFTCALYFAARGSSPWARQITGGMLDPTPGAAGEDAEKGPQEEALVSAEIVTVPGTVRTA